MIYVISKQRFQQFIRRYVQRSVFQPFLRPHIKADLKDGYLTISAHKNMTKEEKDAKGNCVHKERYTGTCNRSFYVGDALTQDDIKAAFKDGVLHLAFPKEVQKQEEQPRLITIE